MQDEWSEYPRALPLGGARTDLLAELATIRCGGRDAHRRRRRRCARFLHDEVEYVPGATEVTTDAADAWDAKRGVCQDMAHLALGVLREARIPARYVSGYLHPSPDPVVGEEVTGESHAWIEWWDDGWLGFDPTNDPTRRRQHVLVARGRDYEDVPPLRGIYSRAATPRCSSTSRSPA